MQEAASLGGEAECSSGAAADSAGGAGSAGVGDGQAPGPSSSCEGAAAQSNSQRNQGDSPSGAAACATGRGSGEDTATHVDVKPSGVTSTWASQDQEGQEEASGKAGGKPRPKLPRPEHTEPCPRCGSGDTKFCYYNNYNIKQPRCVPPVGLRKGFMQVIT